MPKKQMISFDNTQLSVMKDICDEMGDRFRHFKDAEMGWDEDEIDAYWEIVALFRIAQKDAGFWWAP